MSTLPPIELLKLNHSFPGPYTFKLIAHSKDDLHATLIADLKRLLNWKEDPQSSVRKTSDGKHTAITLDLVMRTAEEVHIVYQHLQTVEGVILIL